MAKYVTQIPGNVDEFTRYFERKILDKNLFSNIKHQFRTKVNNVRCCVQVFEGYTFRAGNWLTMDVTVLEHNGELKIAVMTSGGSNAVVLKNWSWGIESEHKMLDIAIRIISEYKPIRLT